MKIKSDFITNSSSTSFILIYEDELSKSEFLKMIGIEEDSALAFLFENLYEKLWEYKKPVYTPHFLFNKGAPPDELKTQVSEALKEGLKVFVGNWSTEVDIIEDFFCTDSFEIKEDKFYLHAFSCYW